jgi:hypothetical protein
MSKQSELQNYIQRVRRMLQVRVGLRGAAIFFATALILTLLLVLLLNHYAFPENGTIKARLILIAALIAVTGAGLFWPLLRLTTSCAVKDTESAHPQLEDRLRTFHERDADTSSPFLELLAADTLARTADAPPSSMAPASVLGTMGGVAACCLGVLLWMIYAGPGFVGYGASLLWTGPKNTDQPLYAIHVTPGDVAVRRNSDQTITAHVTNLHPDKVEIFAHFNGSSGWEAVAMQPAASMSGDPSYQFTFTGLPENVEYYVTAGPLTSPHYKVRVVDLPSVKSVKVTYHYPTWTGQKTETNDHAGDLRAIEGTNAELEIEMDRPLKDGNLTLDNGGTVRLLPTEGNRYKGTVAMNKDGAYHVASTSEGQPVRLSEDYFIATDKAEAPQIAIDKPGRDYRASPIEEVTVGVKGSAQFGLRDMHLHYSVNGGPDKDIAMLKSPGAKNADGSYTLRLEDFKMQPGDLVSVYATARDGHAEAKTDLSFIQADPFEREFSQSQQGGGGGGGGGGQQGGQTEISKREKELIAQTWKQINDKSATERTAKTQGDFLSGAQTKLRDQVMALSARMNSRDLAGANEEFTGFEKDMQEAAKNMLPASEKLAAVKWQDALVNEQKALQALLRAEATFRQIQVAFGQQGGGGGGGQSSGRDLASLFDLELDTEKNQYETARTSSPQEEHAKEVEDALAKLDALAKRQEELSTQQKNPQQSFQERWQQEMLRREAEQLQRQMEQLAKNGQQGQQGQTGQQGHEGQDQQGQTSQQAPSGSQSASGSQQQASSRQQSGGSPSRSDQRIEQALSRMRAANDAMKRAGTSGQSQQGGSTEAQRQAAERLREATGLLGGAQQDIAGNRMGALSHEAERLQQEERAQAERIDKSVSSTQSGTFDRESMMRRMEERRRLSVDRQELSSGLSKLQKDMRETARQMAGSQPEASKKLREALSEMDQSDLDNHVQRTADWLRSGMNPNANGTEKQIAEGLSKLGQQLRSAQDSLGKGALAGVRGTDKGKPDQTAALGQVERLRSQLQAMQAARQGTAMERGQQGQNGRNGAGQSGQKNGQGQTPGSSQQSAQNRQGGGQQPGQSGRGRSLGQQAGNNGGDGMTRGNDTGGASGSGRIGDLGDRRTGGDLRGDVLGASNTGNNTYETGGARYGAKGTEGNPADTERTFQQGLRDLQALRGMVKDDPQAQKDLAELQRQMQGLDPRRFPGNPALVEQMHGEVLRAVDKMELRLQRSGDSTDAHTGKAYTVPAGYTDSVADYYRRLSKGK